MINETYILKLIRLIELGLIIVDDIKLEEYKLEVQNRLSTI